jgi:hypothetical protein
MLAPKEHDQVNRDLELRDLWNMDDAFHPSHDYEGAYRARLNANLAFWDGLDGRTDWPPDDHGAHPLTELVLADFLVVDPRSPDTGPIHDAVSTYVLACGLRNLKQVYVGGDLVADGINLPRQHEAAIDAEVAKRMVRLEGLAARAKKIAKTN